jgi:hypothetical protein
MYYLLNIFHSGACPIHRDLFSCPVNLVHGDISGFYASEDNGYKIDYT